MVSVNQHQWFAVDVHVFDSDLGVDIRERFGVVGLAMWVGFLAACKRNIAQGQIRYATDAEALALLGLAGIELVDEDGEPFTLDDFWTFLGQHKQTSRTTRKRLTDVRATRWEQWQNSARTQRERERKRRSRAQSGRTETGHPADKKRTDSDSDNDSDRTTPLSPPSPRQCRDCDGDRMVDRGNGFDQCARCDATGIDPVQQASG